MCFYFSREPNSCIKSSLSHLDFVTLRLQDLQKRNLSSGGQTRGTFLWEHMLWGHDSVNINKPVHFHYDTASRKKLYVVVHIISSQPLLEGVFKDDCVKMSDSQSNAGKCVTIFVATFLNENTMTLKVLKSNQILHWNSNDRQQQAK